MTAKYYLGIGGFAHDCAAAIFKNGELLAAAPEERFTRVKHEGGIPWRAIEFCLDWAGIEPNDVSVVCHSFWRHKMLRFASSKVLGSIQYPHILWQGANLSEKAIRSYWLGLTALKSEIGLRQLQRKFPRSRQQFVYHHNAHAAAVFLTSPYENATVLIVDSNGDGASTSLYQATDRKLKPRLCIPFPHSLGNFYLTLTAYLGFKAGDEYKVMGLAS
jgi:carbamoyltransferase